MTNRLSLIFSSIALVASLTGVGAYAATQVNGANIKNGSISAAKLSKAAKTALKGERGPAGPAGAAGTDGYDGEDGYDGYDGARGIPGGFDPAKVTYVGTAVSLGVAPDPTSERKTASWCPDGTKVIAGGYIAEGADVTLNGPTANTQGWVVWFKNTTNDPINAGIYAICAAP